MTKQRQTIARMQRGLQPLGMCMRTVAERTLGKKGGLFGQLILEWNTIMRGSPAIRCTPMKLGFPRDKTTGATLTLAVRSADALDMQHAQPQILDRINTFFGYRAVHTLSYVHNSRTSTKISPPKRNQSTRLDENTRKGLEQRLTFVDNNELKDALTNLGTAVIIETNDQ